MATDVKIDKSAIVTLSPHTHLLPSKNVSKNDKALTNAARLSSEIFVSPANNTGR